MKVTALIPARLSSSRFDRKLMMDLCGKSVILRTYEAVVNTNLFDSVYVVTEDEEIYDEIHNSGGNSILSKNQHESGSDRIAEACESISSDAFVNIQGDEPFIDANSLKKLVEELHNSDYVSLMIKISEIQEIENPNNVKVVLDIYSHALYFSRSAIPYSPSTDLSYNNYAYHHLGIYAYRLNTLKKFCSFSISDLERIEKLEQLRALSNNLKLMVVSYDGNPIKGVDTLEDLNLVREMISKQ